MACSRDSHRLSRLLIAGAAALGLLGVLRVNGAEEESEPRAGAMPPCAVVQEGTCAPISADFAKPRLHHASSQPGAVASPTGDVLRQFQAPVAGIGRGLAVDEALGLIYYTQTNSSQIYITDMLGNDLGSIAPSISMDGGPLAWDPDRGLLYSLIYARESYVVFQIDPGTGSTTALCDFQSRNPGDPGVNAGIYPDGLDLDRQRQTLWISGETGMRNWVVEVDLSCAIVTELVMGGPMGVATDGCDLWHSLHWKLVQTDRGGVATGLEFPNLQDEDLDFDPVTFSPLCAVWGNEAIAPPEPNHLTAYQVPCPVCLCPSFPVADAGGPVTICSGATATLDGSASGGCATRGLLYRWLDAGSPVCPWSPLATCDVTPPATTLYTLEVSCAGSPGCFAIDQAQAIVNVEPDLRPGTIGNSLRAIRARSDVSLSWASVPNAATYNLYRGTTKGSWPAALQTGLAASTMTLPDVPDPPSLYFYRTTGASCSGLEGP